MLIFFWPRPLLMKIDATKFAVNMINYSQNITKKQFQHQLKVSSCEQNLLCNTHKEKYCTFTLGEKQ